MSKEFVSISIPEELFDRIKGAMRGTKFKSVDDFIVYLLREAISKLEAKQQDFFTKEEEKKAKERLKGLGYLDDV